jgi:hypothetical protein
MVSIYNTFHIIPNTAKDRRAIQNIYNFVSTIYATWNIIGLQS